MNKLVVMAVLLLAPQLATARVYMCVDPATGKTSFTDQACVTQTAGEEVKVNAANLNSGSRYQKAGRTKTWSSERDNRKTGLDYNAERRLQYQGSATASTQ